MNVELNVLLNVFHRVLHVEFSLHQKLYSGIEEMRVILAWQFQTKNKTYKQADIQTPNGCACDGSTK